MNDQEREGERNEMWRRKTVGKEDERFCERILLITSKKTKKN